MIELGSEKKTYDVEVTAWVKAVSKVSVVATSNSHAAYLAEEAVKNGADSREWKVGDGTVAIDPSDIKRDFTVKGANAGTVQG